MILFMYRTCDYIFLYTGKYTNVDIIQCTVVIDIREIINENIYRYRLLIQYILF